MVSNGRPTRIQVLSDGLSPISDAALTALQVFPGISSAVGFLKAVDDFRNRALLAKLAAFLNGVGEQSEQARAAMNDRLKDPEEQALIGEALLFTLDSYTDHFKCELLGRLFHAYLLDFLTSVELRRLAQAILVAFPDDLKEFLEKQVNQLQPWEDFHGHLASSGLMQPLAGELTGLPTVTPLGEKLKRALQKLDASKAA